MLEDVLLPGLLAHLFCQIEDKFLHFDPQDPAGILVFGVEYPLPGLRIMRGDLRLVSGAGNGIELAALATLCGVTSRLRREGL